MFKKQTEELEILLKLDHYFQTKFECSYFSPNTADPFINWYLLEKNAQMMEQCLLTGILRRLRDILSAKSGCV